MNSKLTGTGSKKRALVVLAIIVGAALLGGGGWTLYGTLTKRPPSTAQVKRSIWKFLAKKADTKDFKPPFDSADVRIISGTTTITNKAGRVKTITKATKSALALPETTVSAYFRTNHEQAASYERMYRLIGEELTVTEHLLASADVPQQLTALVLASEASTHARVDAENLWLGARICEAYLWPNLSLVEATNQALLTVDAVLNHCDIAFKDAGETNHVIRNYEYVLARNQRTPAQLDATRFRLAQVYMDLDEKEKALKLLKEIKNIKSPKLQNEIAVLERDIAAKKQLAEKKK